jgi:O-antigen ligase
MQITKKQTKFIIFISLLLAVISVVSFIFNSWISTGFIIFILICTTLIPLIVKNPVIGPMLIGFFLTFERVPSVEVGGLDIRINFLIIFLTLIIYLSSQLYKQKLKFKFDPIRSSVILFLGLMLVSATQAINLNRAITVIVSMGLMLCLYLVMSMILQKKEDLVFALKGLLWGALVSALFGLYQFFGDMIGLPISMTLLKTGYDSSTFGFARVQAGAYEPLYFANYMFIPVFLILFLNLSGKIKEVFDKRLSITIAILLAINFVLAISRGAFLAAGVTGLILIVIQAKKILTLKNVIIVVCFTLLTIGGVYFALLRSEPRAIDEFISHLMVEDRNDGESVVLRLSTSAEAVGIFSQNLLLGVGPGNFGPEREDYPKEPPEGGWPIVNNEYLEIAAEQGVVGIFGFLLLIVVIISRLIFVYRCSIDPIISDISIALLFAFVAVLIQYATFSTLYITHIWYLIGLIGAVCNIGLKQINDAKKIKS